MINSRQHIGPGYSRERSDDALASERYSWRLSQRTMLGIYCVLVATTVGFAVLATYQWEKQKDASEYAARVSNHNALLSARIEALENGERQLLDLALAGVEGRSAEILSQLESLEEAHSDLASTTAFSKLKESAQGFENKLPEYQTASGSSQIEDKQIGSQQVDDDQPARHQEAATRLEILIKAKEDSWVQILDGSSGKPVFTKLMGPGETYTFTPAEGSTLVTGNAAGLELSVDGSIAPPLSPKPTGRREISLDPGRLLAGTAEATAKPPVPANPEK